MPMRAVSFNEQLNVVGIPARDDSSTASEEGEGYAGDSDAKEYYKKCFRRQQPPSPSHMDEDDDYQPTLGEAASSTFPGEGSPSYCPISSGTWGPEMIPEFMVSSEATTELAEYRRVSIDDGAQLDCGLLHAHSNSGGGGGGGAPSQRGSSFEVSSNNDLTSTGSRSGAHAFAGSATTSSDTCWLQNNTISINRGPAISPRSLLSANRRHVSSMSSSGGGNPLDDDTEPSPHRSPSPQRFHTPSPQRFHTPSPRHSEHSSNVHFLVNSSSIPLPSMGQDNTPPFHLMRLSTNDRLPPSPSSGPLGDDELVASDREHIQQVLSASVEVPDVSASWSDGPTLHEVNHLCEVGFVDISKRIEGEKDSSSEEDPSGDVVEVPSMCSSSGTDVFGRPVL